MPQFRPTDYVDRSWDEHARCEGMDQSIFFPDRGESTAEARAICGDCPVEELCREYALLTGQSRGVWGGTSGRDRRIILRQRREADKEADRAAD